MKKSLPNLTIAILTKDRPRLLLKCIKSIVRQKYYPHRIVVIDSGHSKIVDFIIAHFTTRYHLRSIRVVSTSSNMAALRNEALKSTTTEWLAFIDDDCQLSSSWMQHIALMIRNSQAVAIQGRDVPQAITVPSMLNYLYTFYWKYQASSGWKEMAPVLDTKNVVLNKKWLDQNQITFDESRSDVAGRGEDVDLGMQIHQKGGHIKYHRSILVYHQEPTTVTQLVEKSQKALLASNSVEKKWQLTKKFNVPFYRFLLIFFIKDTYFSWWEKCYLFSLHLGVTFMKKWMWKLS